MWCIPEVTPAFERKMMDVLEQYEAPYDAKEPRIIVDDMRTARRRWCGA